MGFLAEAGVPDSSLDQGARGIADLFGSNSQLILEGVSPLSANYCSFPLLTIGKVTAFRNRSCLWLFHYHVSLLTISNHYSVSSTTIIKT